MDKILYNSENALTITTKLKKKQNQTISLGTPTYVIKLFQKMEGNGTYKIHGISYLLGKWKGIEDVDYW